MCLLAPAKSNLAFFHYISYLKLGVFGCHVKLRLAEWPSLMNQ